jgi:hypothetical protein
LPRPRPSTADKQDGPRFSPGLTSRSFTSPGPAITPTPFAQSRPPHRPQTRRRPQSPLPCKTHRHLSNSPRQPKSLKRAHCNRARPRHHCNGSPLSKAVKRYNGPEQLCQLERREWSTILQGASLRPPQQQSLTRSRADTSRPFSGWTPGKTADAQTCQAGLLLAMDENICSPLRAGMC